ncbi:MAG: 50S ribosomal protein L32 [Bacteroidetes Order II. Incertae sedis bacterium]|nr:50S ribosomal protein L32 [Bacteroidetes Order II. bacterium]MDG1754364.1 50S ribosomal protein L32 [Rhodothermales bacterium]HAY37622.1 50S ribosomal protein L32 [Bacteroidota bacterium]MBT4053443.1 50S ribosomal protein L32 [Bacteroidetes Order II. bacterium]MBT4601685.1 50S ribosomal protein L32 [Bacteroidetes Order II. bacterium]
MANPRRKNSKARTRQRRTTYYNRLSEPTTMECPNCGETKLMHRACPSCGHYRGRAVSDRENA